MTAVEEPVGVGAPTGAPGLERASNRASETVDGGADTLDGGAYDVRVNADRATPPLPRSEFVDAVRDQVSRYRALAVPAAAGFLLRLWIVIFVHPECTPSELAQRSDTCYRLVGDALYYRGQAHYLAKGQGFLNPTSLYFGDVRPGAYHPPLFTVVLGALDLVGIRSIGAHRVALSAIGVAGAVLVGLIAWRLARPARAKATGIVATSIMALCPLFWLNDTTSMSESVYVPLVALLVLCAYRLRSQFSTRSAVLLGVVVGLTMLTRAEAAAFVLVAAILVGFARHLPVARRVSLVMIVGAVALAVVSPWLLYNLSRFPNSTLMTTSTGDALIFRSCDAAFYGDKMGYYELACDPKPNLSLDDESAQDVRSRALAMQYIGSHLDRLPVVAAARFGRMVEVYRPDQNIRFSVLLDNRGLGEARLALASFYALLVPAAFGLRELRRRRTPVSPLLMLLAVVTVTAVMTSPVVRYRVAGDLALVVLAAIGGTEIAHNAVVRYRRRSISARAPARRIAGGVAMVALLIGSPFDVGVAGAQEAGPAPTTTTTYPGNPILVPRKPVTVPLRDPALLVPVPDGGMLPPNCELSDAYQRLFEAWDADDARKPAARLRRYAPPVVNDHLDTMVKFAGDVTKIPIARRKEILRDLAVYSRDSCSIFGTAS